MISCAITRLVFLDGTEVELPAGGVTVIVGPNNAGKTRLIREISELIVHPPEQLHNRVILKDADLSLSGSFDDLLRWFDAHGMPAREVPPRYPGQKFIGNVDQGGLLVSLAEEIWTNASRKRLRELGGFLLSVQMPENRLQMLGETSLHDLERQVPMGPLQRIFVDRLLEDRLSALVHQAFGFEVSLSRYYQQQLFLRRGRPSIPDIPPPASRELLTAYAGLRSLREEGHGVQAFTGLLLHTIISPAEIVLIDEPEAFLHPPQARLIGRVLVDETPENSQVIIATHSSDVLQGLLDGQERPVKVLRLTNEVDQERRVWPLDADQVRELWRDPLLRYSALVDGLFHRGTVVCEGDSDCRFYAASLDFHLRGSRGHDLHFVHVNGKARLHRALGDLRRFGIASAVIADLDLLQHNYNVKTCIEAAGGTYDETIKARLRTVQDAVREKAGHPKWSDLQTALAPFKINMGSSSLRGAGLRLAQASAITPDEQAWARDQAIGLLRREDSSDVHAAALALNHLPAEVTHDVDASLLSSHDYHAVRQLSAVLCVNRPDRYRETAMQLAKDRDYRVRRTLAQAAARTGSPRSEAVEDILRILSHDPRHSVRAATVTADRLPLRLAQN